MIMPRSSSLTSQPHASRSSLSLQCPIRMKCFFPLTWSSRLSSVINFPRKMPSAPVRIWYPSWELPQLPSTPVLTLITNRYNTHLLAGLLLCKILDDKNGLLCLNLHSSPGNFLLVQCLGLCTSMTRGMGLTPGQGTEITQARRKNMSPHCLSTMPKHGWCSIIIIFAF